MPKENNDLKEKMFTHRAHRNSCPTGGSAVNCGTRYTFFSHKECEYFPCHKTKDPDQFNCLFCYCPLYALGDRCGGNFRYTDKGIKDCSNCILPHKRENYGYITGKYNEIKELAMRQRMKEDSFTEAEENAEDFSLGQSMEKEKD